MNNDTPTYKYRAVVYFRNKPLVERLECEIQDTFNKAVCDASGVFPLRRTKGVQILRADTTGVNAGKFFLHQILK